MRLLSLLALPAAVLGHFAYVAMLPNGANVVVNGAPIAAIGHVAPAGGGARNAFGAQFWCAAGGARGARGVRPRARARGPGRARRACAPGHARPASACGMGARAASVPDARD